MNIIENHQKTKGPIIVHNIQFGDHVNNQLNGGADDRMSKQIIVSPNRKTNIDNIDVNL